jgi:hypothetical protein
MNPANGSPEPTEDRLPCPFCAEMIIPAAVLCRFCGRELPRNWATVARGAARSTPQRPKSRDRVRPSIRIAALLVLLFAIALGLQQKEENTSPPSSTAVSSTPASDTANLDRPYQQTAKSEFGVAAGKMIRAWGYDCQTVDAVIPNAWTTAFSHESWSVYCNHMRYSFTLENHGGKWSVKAE